MGETPSKCGAADPEQNPARRHAREVLLGRSYPFPFEGDRQIRIETFDGKPEAQAPEHPLQRRAAVTEANGGRDEPAAEAQFAGGSLDELIRQARGASEGLAFASPGTGSSGHLSLAMLENAANIKVRHVPYRGAAPLVTDVLGGHVPVGIVNVDIPLAHVQAGKLRVLAVTSANRSPLYPDAPTVAESGFPGFEAQGWFGLSAPPRTPPVIISKLNLLANQFLEEGKMKQRFTAGGYLAGGGSPQDYSGFIEREIVKWASVVRANGISME